MFSFKRVFERSLRGNCTTKIKYDNNLFWCCNYLRNFKIMYTSKLFYSVEKIKKYNKPNEFNDKHRLHISVCPTVDEIWKYINNAEFKLDDSVILAAFNRIIQLNVNNCGYELSKLFNFMIEETTIYPTTEHFEILFRGFNKHNEYEYGLQYLNIMMQCNLKPSIVVLNYLIGLCVKSYKFDNGIKLYGYLIDELGLMPNEDTYSTMIQLYTSNDDLDKAFGIIDDAKSNRKLNIHVYNNFLKGLNYQQKNVKADHVYNDINALKDGNELILPISHIICDNFDNELMKSLPNIVKEFYDKITSDDIVKPNIKTFQIMLDILSYYGQVKQCLMFYTELLKIHDLKANISIYNCLLSAYLNQIIYVTEMNNDNETYCINIMTNNTDKIFNLFYNCKTLLIRPNTNTFKILYHSMIGRIFLVNNETNNELKSQESSINNWTKDIENYQIQLDIELLCYFIQLNYIVNENENNIISNKLKEWNIINILNKLFINTNNELILDLTQIPSICVDSIIIICNYLIQHESSLLNKIHKIKIKQENVEYLQYTINEFGSHLGNFTTNDDGIMLVSWNI